MKRPASSESDQLDIKHNHYQIYNLLYWLAKSAPSCPLTKSAFDNYAATHQEFGPREYPNLDWWSGSSRWSGPVSPRTVDELVALSSEEFLLELAAAKPDDETGPTREGLIFKTSEAIARRYEWGSDLVRTLRERGVWDADLWTGIVSGWRRADLTESQWLEVLKTLLEINEITEAIRLEASQLLETGISKASHAVPISCFDLCFRAVNKLWHASLAQECLDPEAIEDWLSLAINRPAGNLVFCWLKLLSRLGEDNSASLTLIPPHYKESLDAIVNDTSQAAIIGRVILASQTLFLFNLDPDWTTEKIVPLFRFSRNPQRAI